MCPHRYLMGISFFSLKYIFSLTVLYWCFTHCSIAHDHEWQKWSLNIWYHYILIMLHLKKRRPSDSDSGFWVGWPCLSLLLCICQQGKICEIVLNQKIHLKICWLIFCLMLLTELVRIIEVPKLHPYWLLMIVTNWQLEMWLMFHCWGGND